MSTPNSEDRLPLLSERDFAGILAALWWRKGIRRFKPDDNLWRHPGRNLHERIADAFQEASRELKKFYRLTFHIVAHWFHRDSGILDRVFFIIGDSYGETRSGSPEYIYLMLQDERMVEFLLERVTSPEALAIFEKIAEAIKEVPEPAPA